MDGVVSIGCKLPHGLVIEVGLDKGGVPSDEYRNVVLNGLSKARVGSKYGVTSVPADIWVTWLKHNTKLRYIVDGSVFVLPEKATAK